MSEINSSEEDVQHILNDPELLVCHTDINAEGLNNIVYPDGTQAILVNGHLLHGDDTVILHEEDLSQFYVNGENGQILITDSQNTSVTESFDDGEIIQFIEEDNLTAEESQIVYVSEDSLTIKDEDLSHYQVTEPSESNNIDPLKPIKFETQIVDLEELMIHGEGDTTILENLNEYQYAILKDGKLHIQSYNGDIIPFISTEDSQIQANSVTTLTNEEVLDISSITGKNLLTGQKVTLHSYMDKLKKKLNDGPSSTVCHQNSRKRKNKNNGLRSLLHKKLNLGKTVNGKQLVGKIIEVKPRGAVDKDQEVQNKPNLISTKKTLVRSQTTGTDCDSSENSGINSSVRESEQTVLESKKWDTEYHDKILVPKIVSKECFEHISRTLGGLMNMDSVRKKLENKTVFVKVVEKTWMHSTQTFKKNISYCSGSMESNEITSENGNNLTNWFFLPDTDHEAYFRKPDKMEDKELNKRIFSEVTNLTLMIIYQKNQERIIRVILNPNNGNKCSKCHQQFRTNLHLRVHLNVAHNTDNNESNEISEKHEETHNNLSEVNCEKNLQSTSKSNRLEEHGTKQNDVCYLECHICSERYSSEATLKKHLTIHMNIKPSIKYYTCDICKRTFSRYSNLQRHVEIHKGEGHMFQCAICGCSYHYMSSLTRHLVQNHVDRQTTEESSISGIYN